MSSKAREALGKIGNISAFVAENCGNTDTAKYMNDIISIVQEALAEPLRNCEVGTAEEQYKRFDKICSGKHTTGEIKGMAATLQGWERMKKEVWHYLSQGVDFFTVSVGPWTITYDKEESEITK
jgi:hypothetical protein